METTLEQERTEVWEGILESLRLPSDPDRAAACRGLLEHLVRSRRRQPAPGSYRLTATDSSKMFCGN
jgi:hypothetical protein